jgi:hypothetical protein
MKDKFAEYYSTPEHNKELYTFIHERIFIAIQLISEEISKKLDIKDKTSNSDGFVSLQMSIVVGMFIQSVQALCGSCKALQINGKDVVPKDALEALINLSQGKNLLDDHEPPK